MLFPLLISCLLICVGAEQPYQERPEAGPEVPSASTTPPREEFPVRERSLARGSTVDPAAAETATADLGIGIHLPKNFPLGSSSSDFLLLDF